MFQKEEDLDNLFQKNRKRFENIISDIRFNYLESVYKKLFECDVNISDEEILGAYTKFSSKIESNSFATAELELVVISVLCHFRPHLSETLLRKGLLAIVYSLGDDIDWFTVKQFIDRRILADKIEPYGGLPPEVGINWLKNILPQEKESVQKTLESVIDENRII